MEPSTNMDWRLGPYGFGTKGATLNLIQGWEFPTMPQGQNKLLWNATGVVLKDETIMAHPEFASHFEASGTDWVLNLRHACSCSANILVLYLLTGTYQDISGRCRCDDFLERRSEREFYRTLRANMLAVKYDLNELSILAKEQLRKQGDQLKLKEILQLLRDIQWLEADHGKDKDLVELLFERAASIRPGEEDEEIYLTNYMGSQEWPYEVMFRSVLKQRAEMQALKRQASYATGHREAWRHVPKS